MIELKPSLYSTIFPGCSKNFFSGSLDELKYYHSDIVVYGNEGSKLVYITAWDISAWITMKNSEYNLLKETIFRLENELIDLKTNSIKIDGEDMAYLLLKYK